MLDFVDTRTGTRMIFFLFFSNHEKNALHPHSSTKTQKNQKLEKWKQFFSAPADKRRKNC